MMKNIIDSYLKKDLSPLQRIEDAWFSLYFVRYWRQWILCNKQYIVDNNFITLNAYICIELNAHSLITYLLALRDEVSQFSSSCYLPWLLGSQPCEQAFHAARSMTSIFSTIINFSMQGLLHRLHKLQSFIDLQSKSDVTNIIYPQKKTHSSKDGIANENLHLVTNISDDQIEEAVRRGFHRAKEPMEELGMKTSLESNNLWEFAFGDVGELANQDDDEVECSSETDKITTATQELYSEEAAAMEYCIEDEKEEHDDVLQVLETFEKKEIITSEGNIKLATVYKSKNFSTGGKTTIPTYKLTESENKERQKFKKDKKFIEIIHNGESVFVRKTTLVWLFQEGERISNDRLFRVRLKQPFNKTLQDDASQSKDSSLLVVNEHISLGDICVFRTPKSISSELFRIGRVTQFAYYKERLKKDRQFKNTTAKIQSSVGALCSWYHPAKENSQLFVHIPNEDPNYVSQSDSYVCTLFFSCFREVKGTEIKGTQLGPLPLQSVLHTARELVISKSAYNFINKIVSDPSQSKQIITIKESSSESITTKVDLTCGSPAMDIAYIIKTNSSY